MKIFLINNFIIFSLFTALFTLKANCQDLLAGEINSAYLYGLTYEITVTLYAKNDTTLPRNIIFLNWGDSSSDTIPKDMEIVSGDIRTLQYKGIHTYPGEGTFNIVSSTYYRIIGINNIPYSDVTPLKIEHTILVTASQNNSTVKYLYPPYDIGISGEIFNYWPGAYEIDGDSLSYSIDLPFGTGSYIPSGMSINSTTGEFLWNLPQQTGYFAIRLVVYEWRNNSIISSTKREMLIKIDSLTNILTAKNLLQPKISVFPNPFSSYLTIVFNSSPPFGGQGGVSFSLYNSTGKSIPLNLIPPFPPEADPPLAEGRTRGAFNTEQLPPGIYLLKANICTDALPCVSQTKKIIKL